MPCRCHRHNARHHDERRHNRRRRDNEENIAADVISGAAAVAGAAAVSAAAAAAGCCGAEAEDVETENVITDRFDCCTTPNSVEEELYSGMNPDILIKTCYDDSGRSYHDARKRCTFWPNFAHPRWLTCDELYDVEID